MSEQDEQTLVQASINGDLNAFGQLVDKYQKTIYSAALSIVRDSDDAEDVTQITFIKAFERLKEFRPGSKFFSWIFKIMQNEAINMASRRRPHQELNGRIASAAANPEQRLAGRERDQLIQDALMDLPLNYRMVVIFRHFADLTYRELGYVLGIPEKRVRSRLFSARRALGDLLSKRGVEAYD